MLQLLRLAIRPALFELHAFLKQSAPSDPKCPWTLKGKRWPKHMLQLPLIPKSCAAIIERELCSRMWKVTVRLSFGGLRCVCLFVCITPILISLSLHCGATRHSAHFAPAFNIGNTINWLASAGNRTLVQCKHREIIRYTIFSSFSSWKHIHLRI